ncbi:MAG: L-aspartate oxidase [Acidimicrobiales bacterium]
MSADDGALAVQHHRMLVVGGGVAALSAALQASECAGAVAPGEPAAVTVLVDTALGGGSSPWAQGGLAAAVGADDSVTLHAQDTVTVSGGVGDAAAARTLAADGPDVVAWLRCRGVRFDLDGAGALSLGREAGHRRHRIVHANGDATGKEIMRALVAAVRSDAAIAVLEGMMVLDLLRDPLDERVVGVLSKDRSGGLTLHLADAVILGTGGYGHLFAATTNPPQVAGAAMAMAIRAGITIADPEMVQFHPTALAAPGLDPKPLLTEALRGEGAWLVDESGHRFMPEVHPDAELAPRDVVARAIYCRVTQGGQVFLDARRAVGERFPERFPTVFAHARAAGIDPRHELLPVSPAAHYCMGGVATDITGASTRPGLWVIGEAASNGVHGANRLASNSLLEGVVMGRAAARAAHVAGSMERPERVMVAASALGCAAADPAVLTRLRELLWRAAGVVREHDGLGKGLAELDALRPAAADGAAGPVARNGVVVADAILTAARRRTESRGAHFRSDHPHNDGAQASRTLIHPAPDPVAILALVDGMARLAIPVGTAVT